MNPDRLSVGTWTAMTLLVVAPCVALLALAVWLLGKASPFGVIAVGWILIFAERYPNSRPGRAYGAYSNLLDAVTRRVDDRLDALTDSMARRRYERNRPK